ncbi:MAG: pilus assembly protein [Gemmatimonadetes bacterium]|nr:pilus assembly protein [Gemmatimonadota bacterium]
MRTDRLTVRRASRRRGSREGGQALVEFALVAPLILLLILGMVDFARAWSAYEVITFQARMGARMAVVDDPSITEADVRQAIEDGLAQGNLDPSQATIGITGFRAGRGTPAQVQIDYPFSLAFVGRFLDWLTGSENLVLTTQFVMRNE